MTSMWLPPPSSLLSTHAPQHDSTTFLRIPNCLHLTSLVDLSHQPTQSNTTFTTTSPTSPIRVQNPTSTSNAYRPILNCPIGSLPPPPPPPPTSQPQPTLSASSTITSLSAHSSPAPRSNANTNNMSTHIMISHPPVNNSLDKPLQHTYPPSGPTTQFNANANTNTNTMATTTTATTTTTTTATTATSMTAIPIPTVNTTHNMNNNNNRKTTNIATTLIVSPSQRRQSTTQQLTGQKKLFHCPVPGCKQTSSNKGNLSKHIATRHEHRKDYECPFDDCTRRFAKKYNMLRHLSASGVHRPLKRSNIFTTNRTLKSKSSTTTATLNSTLSTVVGTSNKNITDMQSSTAGVTSSTLRKRRRSASRSRWSSMELDLAQFLAQQCKWRTPVKAL